MTQLTKIPFLHHPPLKKFRVKTLKSYNWVGKKGCVLSEVLVNYLKTTPILQIFIPHAKKKKKADILTTYTFLKGKSVPWDPSVHAEVGEKSVRK